MPIASSDRNLRDRSIRSGGGGLRAFVTLSLALLLSSSLQAEDDAFDLLGGLRASLRSQSPFTAQMRQTLVWADGWDFGDEADSDMVEESAAKSADEPNADDDWDDLEADYGEMSVSLPSCLRWDVEGDFPQSFLLCDDLAHKWAPGDRRGRRIRIDDEMASEAPGLDFFLLSVTELRARYRVGMVRRVEGSVPTDRPALLDAGELVRVPGIHIQLFPLQPIPEVAQLDLVLDAGARRVHVLTYVDEQGTRNTYEFYGYSSGVSAGAFAPPGEMKWEDS